VRRAIRLELSDVPHRGADHDRKIGGVRSEPGAGYRLMRHSGRQLAAAASQNVPPHVLGDRKPGDLASDVVGETRGVEGPDRSRPRSPGQERGPERRDVRSERRRKTKPGDPNP
jgi:hypothetical protein